jgi:abortive infection bacteriophage resistance protein
VGGGELVSTSNKKPKKKEELLKIWKDKKLEIENEEFALEIIQRLNYYRLSGYAKYFYNENREFITGTNFNDIYNLYLFDSELRKIVMALTEEIELNFRSYISSYIANTYGACAYLETKHFENKINHKNDNGKSYYEEFIETIKKKKKNAENKPYIKPKFGDIIFQP